ncbi:ATP synthase subunit g, mitochondrial [Harpegnathos saltator]|uniref:ATP synthase subunit g n=1 Tax=Harpegnathos saltator TaxID=610380 RepID=E2BFJ2_HARSA|nr:ATP synthase subunit g, mitochondrial [Harpegnathos saltator]EFN85514.1 ATP synthase subunit g, mitochondrial [Harpegnathos saltator]
MASFMVKTINLTKAGIKKAIPVLNVWKQYAMVELTPPSPRDIPAIRNGFAKLVEGAKTGRFREVTVREAVINTLVTIEVYCWFYVGECIGKRHFVGYDV